MGFKFKLVLRDPSSLFVCMVNRRLRICLYNLPVDYVIVLSTCRVQFVLFMLLAFASIIDSTGLCIGHLDTKIYWSIDEANISSTYRYIGKANVSLM